MKSKVYKSFNELDKDIEITKLERDIYREKVFLQAEKLKVSFSPSSLLRNTIGGGGESSSSSLVMNVLNIALPFILKKFRK